MDDTIFALSSGMPPAAIAVVRISGPAAATALTALAGSLPSPRRASFRTLRAAEGELDRALVLYFPGPATATGEDLAELHLHGGRAVVAAVENALAALDLGGAVLRRATPGEFTRRAFANGRIDLAEAEGLADLLSAETELQRRSAMALAGGAFSKQVEQWRDRVLTASASVEAALDFDDEDDVGELPADFRAGLEMFHVELCEWLARPRAEALRDGIRVALAGPPNAGKSTLFNALVGDESAAIVTPLAGTTRDVLTRPIALAGIPFTFIDTAGLRDETDDSIEAIGIARARDALGQADIVLWLGPEGEGPAGAWEITAQTDRTGGPGKRTPRHAISAITGAGMEALRDDLIATAATLLPKGGAVALNARQHRLIGQAADGLGIACGSGDPLIVAEGLRLARLSFDALIGRSTTEDMLDALFGRFCIGK
ncbi:tRNA uridine-5-carboxymethylaminomethyl(34) synthesis GTPase MnmE [Novosphingobium colocasiae]|uniref:tRNA modification GTPase MnmE n=1 Tax=Novosphingobium colocasiae TaxID=1256513 RepID=A0A918PF41_9SPHN|nr:tRNA uridine-5-carboxymethylaminomethyl(34) synthesis GTPase MnmE [Novosphingobium colocasiae]GGZ05066.1 tRNA modification GTPase MnmE [Novosphingobium colocasiae]